MSIRKKIILSLSVVFSMLVALVVGLVNMPSIKQSTNTPNITNGETYDNKVGIKPSTTPISFEYEADARLQTANNSQTEKVYKFGFGNTMTKTMALKLLTNLEQDNVTVKYAYGDVDVYQPTLAKLQATDGITIGATYEMQRLSGSTTIYVYVIVSVVDTSISTSFATSLSWGYGVPTTVTYTVAGTTYTSDEIENLAMPEPETPEVSEGMVFAGWYLDEECTIPATFPLLPGNTQLYVKEEEQSAGNIGGSWFQLNEDGLGYTVITGETISGQFPSDGKVIIPETWKGLPVTSIGDYAFDSCSRLTSITIPAGVISIEPAAFTSCIGLTSVEFGDNSQLTSIGNYAFDFCSGLTSITIPSSVTKIGMWAFHQCYKLEASGSEGIIFEDTSTWYYTSSDSYTDGTLIDVTTNATNLVSNYESYYWYKSDEDPSAGNLGSSWFQLNSDGQSYTVINGQTTSDQFPSDGNVVIPKSWEGKPVTAIADGDSYNYGTRAFYGTNIKSVVIPNTMTTIGKYAFYECSDLTSVTFDNNSQINTIKEGAFSSCYQLSSVDFGTNSQLLVIEDGVFSSCPKLTQITLPNRLTTIGTALDYSGLTSITIPASVTSISIWALGGSDIISISVESGNTVYDSRDNCNAIIETATNTLISACKNTVILDSIEIIGDAAFYNRPVPANITLGANSQLTTIGKSAFQYSTLGIIDVSACTKLTCIDSCAFAWTSGLTSFTIPESVTQIGYTAFEGSSLTSITFEDTSTWYYTSSDTYKDGTSIDVTTATTNATNLVSTYSSSYWYKSDEEPYPAGNLGSSWFQLNSDGQSYMVIKGQITASQFPADKNVIIPKTWEGLPVTTMLDATSSSNVSDGVFEGSSIVSVTIPSTITNIGKYAFNNCSTLTSVTFANNSKLSSIGDSAFYYCSGLTSITIPSSVASIGNYAFYYCNRLTSVYFEENSKLTSIGEAAFSACSGLTSITIPEGVTSIGVSAFSACSGLTSITIPEGVTSIGCGAFLSCGRLTSITIPASVTSIEYNAFYQCSGLTSVEFKDTTQWYVYTTLLSSTTLANTSTAATCLKSTYCIYTWNKGGPGPAPSGGGGGGGDAG